MSARRRAVMDVGAIAKSQGMRLGPGSTIAHFTTEADSLEWLFGEEGEE